MMYFWSDALESKHVQACPGEVGNHNGNDHFSHGSRF